MKRFVAAAAAAAFALCVPTAAHAAGPDFSLTFPDGLACSGFALQIDGWNSANRPPAKMFYDKDGNLLRVLSPGPGSDLTYTNLSTGKSYQTKANGATYRTTINADGSQSSTATGHNVLIMYPTDIPAGPSTTLYVGQVKTDVSADGVTTVTSTSGRAIDICALVS